MIKIFFSQICSTHFKLNHSHWVQKSGSILTNIFDLDLFPSKRVTEVPQCIMCHKTLSNDGMRPTRLERHLKTMHPALAAKPKAFLKQKGLCWPHRPHSLCSASTTLKQAKMDSSGTFQQQTSKVVETSNEIAMLITKSKNSHNIGETLINQVYCEQQSSFWGRIVQTSFPKSLYQTISSRKGSMKCLKTLKINFSTK